jgi:hypothetical protein
MGGATGAQRWLVYEEYRTGRHAAPQLFPHPWGRAGAGRHPGEGPQFSRRGPQDLCVYGDHDPLDFDARHDDAPLRGEDVAGSAVGNRFRRAPPPWGDLGCTPGAQGSHQNQNGNPEPKGCGGLAGGGQGGCTRYHYEFLAEGLIPWPRSPGIGYPFIPGLDVSMRDDRGTCFFDQVKGLGWPMMGNQQLYRLR